MCCIMKYGLFITNLVFALAGLAVLGLGIAVIVQLSDLLALIPVNINAVPISLIVLGSFIFLTAFFGCCGAIRENRCFLTTYAIIIISLAAGKTYLAVVVFGALDSIRDTVVDWLGRAFNNNDLRDPFHLMETAFRCCGTTGPNSYVGILPQLPPTCCQSPDANNTCDLLSAYDGCNDLVGSFFETFTQAIGSVVVVIIGVEIVLAVFTVCLCSSVRNKRFKGMNS